MNSSNYSAKYELYKFISLFKQVYKIHKYPVDTIQICNDDDTTVLCMHNFKTIGFCGAAFPGDKKDTIILNSNRSPKQLNFDCGHEIIHLIKHKEQVDGAFTCFEKSKILF